MIVRRLKDRRNSKPTVTFHTVTKTDGAKKKMPPRERRTQPPNTPKIFEPKMICFPGRDVAAVGLASSRLPFSDCHCELDWGLINRRSATRTPAHSATLDTVRLKRVACRLFRPTRPPQLDCAKYLFVIPLCRPRRSRQKIRYNWSN